MSEGECGVFFFLNKNKPKGRLGVVVPAASLASRSGRIWLHETLGPHFPTCPASRLFRPPLPFLFPRRAQGMGDGQSFGEGAGRVSRVCGNWLGARGIVGGGAGKGRWPPSSYPELRLTPFGASVPGRRAAKGANRELVARLPAPTFPVSA